MELIRPAFAFMQFFLRKPLKKPCNLPDKLIQYIYRKDIFLYKGARIW